MAITPEQSKAARSLLGWSQETLAKVIGISSVSIENFEKGQGAFRSETLLAMENAFTNQNVDFPDEYLVRRRAGIVETLQGYNALTYLWDDIFECMKKSGGEILITNVDEKRTGDIEQKNLIQHINRLKQYKITERLLSCEGDTTFIMPQECYRWLPKALFSPSTSTYLYADRVALQIWGEDMIVLIQNKTAFEAEKKRFEYHWENALIPPVSP